MKEKQTTLFVLSIAIGLTVVLGRCSPVPASSEAMSATPETVVESFYNWYAGYPGNSLVDGAYRSSEYLTEELIQKVDGIIASFDKGGYDPFLCAQDIPGKFAIEKAVMSGEEASVIVHEIWNAGTQYELNRDVIVVLRVVNGQWKIADIICNASPPVTPVANTAALPPALSLQTLSGHGFALRYPANARVEVYEDHLRILGPEIGIRPADADWGWMTWAYEMDIGIFDNPDGLSAAVWARQYILPSGMRRKRLANPSPARLSMARSMRTLWPRSAWEGCLPSRPIGSVATPSVAPSTSQMERGR